MAWYWIVALVVICAVFGLVLFRLRRGTTSQPAQSAKPAKPPTRCGRIWRFMLRSAAVDMPIAAGLVLSVLIYLAVTGLFGALFLVLDHNYHPARILVLFWTTFVIAGGPIAVVLAYVVPRMWTQLWEIEPWGIRQRWMPLYEVMALPYDSRWDFIGRPIAVGVWEPVSDATTGEVTGRRLLPFNPFKYPATVSGQSVIRAKTQRDMEAESRGKPGILPKLQAGLLVALIGVTLLVGYILVTSSPEQSGQTTQTVGAGNGRAEARF